MDVVAGSVNEESGEQVYVDSQSTSVLPTFPFVMLRRELK